MTSAISRVTRLRSRTAGGCIADHLKYRISYVGPRLQRTAIAKSRSRVSAIVRHRYLYKSVPHRLDLFGYCQQRKMARSDGLRGHELWTQLLESTEICHEVACRNVGNGHATRPRCTRGVVVQQMIPECRQGNVLRSFSHLG